MALYFKANRMVLGMGLAVSGDSGVRVCSKALPHVSVSPCAVGSLSCKWRKVI